MKHTPLPWVIRTHPTNKGLFFIEGPRVPGVPYAAEIMGEDYTAHGGEERKLADARFIVRACNAHDALFEALLLALPYVEDVLANKEQLACFKPGVVQAHRKEICAALAKAEGR